jgi:general secretion pathway protein L
VPLLAFEGDEIVLVQPESSSGGRPRIDLRALDEARSRGAFRTLLEGAGETRGRVRLRLQRGESLSRRVTMPAATEENLRQVLSFEMDRLTPFPADEVYFDYRVASRDAAAGKLAVHLVIARRDLVNSRVERLRALGGNVQGVIAEDAPAAGSEALDLLPSEQRGERESARERLVQRSLAGACVLLLALALLIPIWRKRETVIAVQPLLVQARQQAEVAGRLSTSLEREVNDYNFLLARKYSSYPVLAFVEELTRLLPDNTWLQQMTVNTSGRGREIQITGETSSSSRLIEILEQSKLLRNATPRGTVTRGSTPNSERFMIAAEASPRPKPEPEPVLQAGQQAAQPVQPAQPARGAQPARAAQPAPPPPPAGPAAASFGPPPPAPKPATAPQKAGAPAKPGASR